MPDNLNNESPENDIYDIKKIKLFLSKNINCDDKFQSIKNIFKISIEQNYVDIVYILLKEIKEPKERRKLIEYDNFFSVRKSVSLGDFYIVARLSYEIDDIPTLKKQVFNIRNNIDNSIYIYKDNIYDLIELGRIYKNLFDLNWTKENLDEIKKSVKYISNYTMSCKDFVRNAFDNKFSDHILSYVIDYSSYQENDDIDFSKSHKLSIFKAIQFDKNREKPKNNMEAKLNFMNRLVETYKNSGSKVSR